MPSLACQGSTSALPRGIERAAAFYAHLGFVPIGPRRGPGDGWLLGRQLAAEDPALGGDRMEDTD